eukprot:scaffold52888_cov70-Phaeocystis_antarctica.AAC.10
MPDSRSLNPKTSSRPVVVAPCVGPRHQRNPRPVTASTTCVVTAGSGGSKSGISAPEVPSTALPTRSWHRTVTKYCRPCCICGLGTQTCAVDRFASAGAGPNWSLLPGSVPICQVQFRGWLDHGAASAHAQRAVSVCGSAPNAVARFHLQLIRAVGTLRAQWQHEFLWVVALRWRGVINVDHGHPGTIFALARAIWQGAVHGQWQQPYMVGEKLGLGVEGTAPFRHKRVRLAVRRGGTSYPRRELLGEAEFHSADVGRRRVEEETIPTGSTARVTLAGQLTQLPREAIEVALLFRIEQPRLGFVRAGLGTGGEGYTLDRKRPVFNTQPCEGQSHAHKRVACLRRERRAQLETWPAAKQRAHVAGIGEARVPLVRRNDGDRIACDILVNRATPTYVQRAYHPRLGKV